MAIAFLKHAGSISKSSCVTKKKETHTHTHISAGNPYSCQVWEWWEQKRDHCCHFLGPLCWQTLVFVLMSLAGSEGFELPNVSFPVQCPTFHSVYHTLSPQYTLTIKKIICICYIQFSSLSKGEEHIGSDLPGGTVVESPPANAGNMGLISGLGGSHVPRNGQAREPQLLSMRAWSPCSAIRGDTAMRNPCPSTKSSPHSQQVEKARAQQQRPNTAKNK